MSRNVQIIKWAPCCEDDTVKPSTGRTFDTLTKAKEFHTCYARLSSSSIRRGTLNLDKNRELVGKNFLRSKGGYKSSEIRWLDVERLKAK